MAFIKIIEVFKLLVIPILFVQLLVRVECLEMNYPTFTKADRKSFQLLNDTDIIENAIQVTRDVRGAEISNLSGRVFFHQMFKLHSKKKNITASFNSTFVLNIQPESSPGGEGLTFILTKDDFIPENSHGQWLGMVNSTTNGSLNTQTVAIEFDTKKSFDEDIDSNHVGVNLNSINSIVQIPLMDYGVNLSSATSITATILYDGQLKKMDIYVFMTAAGVSDRTMEPIISMNLTLSDYLPEKVWMGFSGSTGATTTQLNCIKAWFFTSTHIDDGSSHLWRWILIGFVLIFLLCGLTYYTYHKLGKKRIREHDQEEQERYPGIEQELQTSSTTPQKYELKELVYATDNFNPINKLGEGGFGKVYKGLLNHIEVAVKRISKDSRQGKQEFLAEIKTISGLHHKNLVKLLGWCYEKNELLLVYEFMPNGSLEKLIFMDKNQDLETPAPISLTWETRHAIIYGVGEALDYLHNGCEKRVLHRDIKASNIMLDSDMNARLGDFGLARTIRLSERTHHSTKEIAGTPGYIAPEFFHTGRASVEIDVYAFGILLLEVTCGKRHRNWKDHQNEYVNAIVEWVWELYRLGQIIDAVDSRLNGEYQSEEAECVLLLGLACCHPNPHQRPTMRSVLQVLSGEADPPNVPVDKPVFMWPAMMPLSFNLEESSLSGSQITPFSEISGR